MHLVGFIIRIYHDAPSSERQISRLGFSCLPYCYGLSEVREGIEETGGHMTFSISEFL